MNVHRNAVTKSSLNKGLNPYKACIYGLCRDFLDGIGYNLCTKFYFDKCIALSSVRITWGIKNKVRGTVFV